MSNEATTGFDCSQSRVWLNACFRRVYVRNGVQALKETIWTRKDWGGTINRTQFCEPIDGVERLVRKLVQNLYPNLQELKNLSQEPKE